MILNNMSYKNNSFGWSSSRSRLFYTCQKKYYFNYYVNNLKDLGAEYWLEGLLLKNLTSYKMWLGTHTHNIISDYLHVLADKKSNLKKEDISNIKNIAFKDMKAEFDLAKNRNYEKYDKNMKFGFKEFAYGKEFSGDLDELIQIVFDNLDALIGGDLNEKITRYFTNGNKYYIEPKISDFDKMKLILDEDPILKNVIIWAQPDFGVLGDDGIYYIYDWKSGSKRDCMDDEVSDQLKVYACRLLKNMNKTLQDIQISAYEVYVPSMEVLGGKVFGSDIDYIKGKIKDDVFALSKLLEGEDIVLNQPKSVNNFSRTKESGKCTSCRFRRLCAKLKKIDGDSYPNSVLDGFFSNYDNGALF